MLPSNLRASKQRLQRRWRKFRRRYFSFAYSAFSADGDNVNQWAKYAKGNGYAIGFFPAGLNRESNSTLYPVVYDKNEARTMGGWQPPPLRYAVQGFAPLRRRESQCAHAKEVQEGTPEPDSSPGWKVLNYVRRKCLPLNMLRRHSKDVELY
jgi:hypothetical protein